MSQDGWSLEQEEAPCTPSASPPSLCSNNCGFFGSPATMNLCSSCYKNLVLLKPPPPVQACASLEPEEPKIDPVPSPFEPASSLSSSASSSAFAECSVAVASIVDGSIAASVLDGSVLREKVQPLRCFACQKKVGLRGFKCRCGDVFCAYHRYSDQHSCSFDYKAAGRVSIEVANPVVKAEKLHRI